MTFHLSYFAQKLTEPRSKSKSYCKPFNFPRYNSSSYNRSAYSFICEPLVNTYWMVILFWGVIGPVFTCVHMYVALCRCRKCFFHTLSHPQNRSENCVLGTSRFTTGSLWFFPLTLTRKASLTLALLMFTISVLAVLPKLLNKVVIFAQSL